MGDGQCSERGELHRDHPETPRYNRVTRRETENEGQYQRQKQPSRRRRRDDERWVEREAVRHRDVTRLQRTDRAERHADDDDRETRHP